MFCLLKGASMAKRIFFFSVVLTLVLANIVVAVDVAQLFNQVKSELLQKGVAAVDVNTIQPAATSLLGLGITKASLVNMVVDLVALKIKGTSLNGPLQALQGLVQSGEKPNIASNLIATAINQAKTQNLTGNAAVSKIVDFINQKKSEVLALKEKAKNQIQTQQGKINKSLDSFLGK
jgi:hypothetical protein